MNNTPIVSSMLERARGLYYCANCDSYGLENVPCWCERSGIHKGAARQDAPPLTERARVGLAIAGMARAAAEECMPVMWGGRPCQACVVVFGGLYVENASAKGWLG